MSKRQGKIHFIAIGGSVMHNLAVALKRSGYEVTGSDDEIFDPARTILEKNGLLPEKTGWYPEKISANLEAVIVGMHARKDNPELLQAQKLGIPTLSFPEFIYRHAENKQRIVIAGSHGKSTITGMIVHVLSYYNRSFDFVMGARVIGMEDTVRLSDEAPIIIIEGDEYPSSPENPKPKFLEYHHHIGLISGVAWDHANVFPDENTYVKQFDLFADSTPKGGILVYYETDPMANVVGAKEREDVLSIPYKLSSKTDFTLKIPGKHNIINAIGAREVLKKIGVTPEQFNEAIKTFEGVAGRLQLLAEQNSCAVFKDFAHAPSKVKASVKAIHERNPDRSLVACLELHTFSSLSKNYIPQYKGAMKDSDTPIVYFNPETVEAKRLEPLDEVFIKQAFNHPALVVFDDTEKLRAYLTGIDWKNKNLLFMSSGNFGGLDIPELAEKLPG